MSRNLGYWLVVCVACVVFLVEARRVKANSSSF
jgi:hypothetical protein